MKITSPHFDEGNEIPKKFGYNFNNINPKLEINEIPSQTKSIALIMDDPDALDAVGKIWVHWIMCNIIEKTDKNSPKNLIIETGIENSKLHKNNSAILGRNDFNEMGYGGPAPPDKRHTYFFKIYALDKKLSIKEGFSKQDLENEIQNHVISKAQLTGTFAP